MKKNSTFKCVTKDESLFSFKIFNLICVFLAATEATHSCETATLYLTRRLVCEFLHRPQPPPPLYLPANARSANNYLFNRLNSKQFLKIIKLSVVTSSACFSWCCCYHCRWRQRCKSAVPWNNEGQVSLKWFPFLFACAHTHTHSYLVVVLTS